VSKVCAETTRNFSGALIGGAVGNSGWFSGGGWPPAADRRGALPQRSAATGILIRSRLGLEVAADGLYGVAERELTRLLVQRRLNGP